MQNKFVAGRYVNYPCVKGCNHHLQLKEDISELAGDAEVSLECPTCDIERKYSVKEVMSIINSMEHYN
ncbi:hypothetical protein MWH28_07530 [Natroniella sulfidigena]|uniref:hypothetical protein n=1 Tax=Natroniella sulfidigena TaxID=723921 RepID=UPI00200A6F48|nr:hypothetical protein [Natroniella sulfidigena]MCK8817209.1 hypothetical protein [Natroniella sulfidigena]